MMHKRSLNKFAKMEIVLEKLSQNYSHCNLKNSRQIFKYSLFANSLAIVLYENMNYPFLFIDLII